jgi:DNA-binding transcriptional LysR family regulator
MELRHLRYFIAVAEELNFTRASERLHIAQPPLSRQIQQLEEEVGVQLLVRDRRKVVLTPEGRKFLQEARKVIAQAEHALESVRRDKQEQSGIVHVGIATFLAERIAPIIAEHAKRFPNVELQCKDIRSPLQCEALVKRTIDVGFLRPPVDRRQLMYELLFNDPIMVLVAKSNPLSKEKSLSMRQLATQTLMLPERHVSTGIYDKVLKMYRRAGPNAKIVQTQTGPYEDAGTMLVAAGKGIFLASASRSERSFQHQVTAVSLKEPDAFFEVLMAWRRGEKSAVILNLLETARHTFHLKKHTSRV